MRELCVAVLVLVFAFAAGCGGKETAEQAAERATERAVEAAGGGKVAVDASSNVDMSTLPDFLHYPGIVATEKLAISTSEGKGTVWTLTSADGMTAVADWYRASLSGQGWTSESEMTTAETVLQTWSRGEEAEKVALMFTVEEGKTKVSLSHAVK